MAVSDLPSCPICLTPVVGGPGVHQIGNWVGPRAILDSSGEEKISCPCWDTKPRQSSLWPDGISTVLSWLPASVCMQFQVFLWEKEYDNSTQQTQYCTVHNSTQQTQYCTVHNSTQQTQYCTVHNSTQQTQYCTVHNSTQQTQYCTVHSSTQQTQYCTVPSSTQQTQYCTVHNSTQQTQYCTVHNTDLLTDAAACYINSSEHVGQAHATPYFKFMEFPALVDFSFNFLSPTAQTKLCVKIFYILSDSTPLQIYREVQFYTLSSAVKLGTYFIFVVPCIANIFYYK